MVISDKELLGINNSISRHDAALPTPLPSQLLLTLAPNSQEFLKRADSKRAMTQKVAR